jgi:lipopolysaccharide/colanic/teichoic acid biosynthesis glycosyltransferase
VLFTEIGQAEGPVLHAIIEKISLALRRTLSDEQFRHIRLTFRLFPDQSVNEPDSPDCAMFYPDLPGRADSSSAARFVKRLMDVLGSLAAVVLLSPIFVCLAILIKATSRGPVLYCQKRVGMYGKTFRMLKLRSMYADNDPLIHQQYVARLIAGGDDLQQPTGKGTAFKLTNDPRVTPVGAFLRKSSLDELPQFINVFLGHMSLVGPRPPVPYEYERYRTWHKSRVVEVKPGLTGLWQVAGRSKTTFDEMVRMDLKYARVWSLWLDLKILLQTPLAVVSGDGAY